MLAPYVSADTPRHEGKRIVRGAKMVQSETDILLGWRGPTPALLTRDKDIAGFAMRYADQTRQDFDELSAAVAAGTIEAQVG